MQRRSRHTRSQKCRVDEGGVISDMTEKHSGTHKVMPSAVRDRDVRVVRTVKSKQKLKKKKNERNYVE